MLQRGRRRRKLPVLAEKDGAEPEPPRRLRSRTATRSAGFLSVRRGRRDAGGPGSGVRSAFIRWLDEVHGDADLGVDDSGNFVLDTMLPPDVATSIRDAMPLLGIKPRELFMMMFGGGVGDDALVGSGIDPDAALRILGP